MALKQLKKDLLAAQPVLEAELAAGTFEDKDLGEYPDPELSVELDPQEPSQITITLDGDSRWVETEGKTPAQLAQEIVNAGLQLIDDMIGWID